MVHSSRCKHLNITVYMFARYQTLVIVSGDLASNGIYRGV